MAPKKPIVSPVRRSRRLKNKNRRGEAVRSVHPTIKKKNRPKPKNDKPKSKITRKVKRTTTHRVAVKKPKGKKKKN